MRIIKIMSQARFNMISVLFLDCSQFVIGRWGLVQYHVSTYLLYNPVQTVYDAQVIISELAARYVKASHSRAAASNRACSSTMQFLGRNRCTLYTSSWGSWKSSYRSNLRSACYSMLNYLSNMHIAQPSFGAYAYGRQIYICMNLPSAGIHHLT